MRAMMPRLTIVFGVLLVLQGLGFWMASSSGSFTAAIPAIPGGLFMLFGAVAMCAPGARKHIMHVVMLLALLGAAAALWKAVPGFMQEPAPATKVSALVNESGMTSLEAKAQLASIHWAKLWSQSLMAAFCLGLMVLGVRSFVQARAASSADESA